MQEFPDSAVKMRREQRKHFRFPVEGEAIFFRLDGEEGQRCRMLDLGLGGCRLHQEDDFDVPDGAQMEVAFRFGGAAFRFAGGLAWPAKNRTLGIHFQQIASHRKKEFAELLGELREEMDARLEALIQEPESMAESNSQDAASSRKDRRVHHRHTVSADAQIKLLSLHKKLVSHIVDVSLGGCRIRTEERFPVGAYRRVEVKFTVDGMSLFLPGVTQVLYDKFTVGIRFVEVTERKRVQLSHVLRWLERPEGNGHQ